MPHRRQGVRIERLRCSALHLLQDLGALGLELPVGDEAFVVEAS